MALFMDTTNTCRAVSLRPSEPHSYSELITQQTSPLMACKTRNICSLILQENQLLQNIVSTYVNFLSWAYDTEEGSCVITFTLQGLAVLYVHWNFLVKIIKILQTQEIFQQQLLKWRNFKLCVMAFPLPLRLCWFIHTS